MSVDPLLYRKVMGRFATGVTIVTARHGDERHGMTATAFTSVSLDPTLVLVCADLRGRTHRLIAESGAFAVNILGEHQQDLSDLFAGRRGDVDRFATVEHRHGVTGSPLIAGCLGYLDCRLYASYPGGDHTIYVGEVVEAALGAEDDPLMVYRGRYRHLRLPPV